MKRVLLFLIIATLTYSNPVIDNSLDKLFQIVPIIHEIEYKNDTHSVDMRSLLEHTASIESNYGLDKYSKNNHAISPFQYEKTTVDWAFKVSKELKLFLEESLGFKIDYRKSSHSPYVAYIIYMSKIRYHREWLDKFEDRLNGDLEYRIYKCFYNSLIGASTYETYQRRVKEMESRRLKRSDV